MNGFKARLLSTISTVAMVAGTCAVISLPAAGQEQRSTAPQNKAEEIVVTGQRRAQNLQNVPAAVSAVSSKKLEESGIQSFEDLQKLTPALSIVDGLNARFLNIRAEGIGVSTPFQNAGVPLMIDNLFIPRGENFLRDAMFDLDQIEVYRGPQGTYAGQNSTGGAIFITAKQPSFDAFTAYIEQTFGDYDWYKTQAAANLPINDKWAARIAVDAESRSSFYRNDPGTAGPSPVAGVNVYNESQAGFGVLEGASHPGDLGKDSVRTILRFKPNDDLDIRARFDEIHQRDDGEATERSVPFHLNDPSLIPDPWTVHQDFPGWNRLDVQRGTLNVEWSAPSWMTVKSVSGYQHFKSNAGADSDASSPFQPLSVLGAAASGLGTTIPQTFNTFLNGDSYYYQEIDFVSKGDGPFSWVLGGDGLYQNTVQHSDAYVYGYTGNSTGGVGGSANGTCSPASGSGATAVTAATQCAISYVNISGGTLNTSGPNAGKISSTPGESRLDYYQEHQSQAVFGDVTYKLLPTFDVSAGFRYTWDRIALKQGSTANYYLNVPGVGTPGWYVGNSTLYQTVGLGAISPISCGGALGAGPPAGSAPQDGCHVFGAGQFKLPTGRVAFTWRVTPDLTAYATYSVGSKPGGFQTQLTLNAVGPQPPYSPEIVRNYEAGIKSVLWDGHLRANLTGFYDDYRNWQAAFRIPGFPIGKTVNMAKSELYGVETQLDASFGDLSLDFNLAYLHSKLLNAQSPAVPASEYGPNCPTAAGSYAGCPGGVMPAGNYVSGGSAFINPVGEPLNYAPQLTINFSVKYDFHLLGGTVTPYFQYSYLSDQWVQLYHASQDYIPEHTVMDFRLAYKPDEHWRAEAFVTNIADELYLTNVTGGGSATPYLATLSLGAPRQVGVRFAYTY